MQRKWRRCHANLWVLTLGFCQFLRGQAMGLERFWQERSEGDGQDPVTDMAKAGARLDAEVSGLAGAIGSQDEASEGTEGRGRRGLAERLLRLLGRALGPEPAVGDATAWLAVFLWAGAASWFLLPMQPGLLATSALVAPFLAFGSWHAAKSGRRIVLLLAVLLSGFVLVSWRAQNAGVRLLPANVGWVQLVGQVERTWYVAPGRLRMILRVIALPEVRKQFVPQRVRITLLLSRKHDGDKIRQGGLKTLPLPGAIVRMRVHLGRLPQPVEPGGYDPARALYFKGIGAVGFAHEHALSIVYGGCWTCSLFLREARKLERWRRIIAGRMRQVMRNEDAAALAAALVIGARGQLSQARREALRAAGLAHILAISGLHLALVAGAVFQAVRFLLAVIPGLALRTCVRKWAALAALLAAGFYLLLSGNSVATQRAFVMLAVMTLALLLDRPALSMRNLGLAALLILLLHPEKAVTAGFQMSFLAVAGLIAVYETARHVRQRHQAREDAIKHPQGSQGMLRRWLRVAFLSLLALMVTTLVAAMMTALPAAWHFHRLSRWGMFGNLVALPVVSLLVMPAGVLALVLMPLGLDAPVWQVMEAGLHAILSISAWIAGWPRPWLEVAQMRLAAAVLIAVGLLWLCLRRDGWRLAGMVPILAGILMPPALRPDILVDGEGKVVAVRTTSGRLAASPGRAGRFALSIWLQRDGDPATPAEARKREGWTCDPSGVCRAEIVKGGRKSQPDGIVAYLPATLEQWMKDGEDRRHAFAKSCAGADIVIASFPLRGACGQARTRIDRFTLWRQGAQAIWLDEEGRIRRRLDILSLRRRFPWGHPPLPRKKVRKAMTNTRALSTHERKITEH